MTKRQLIELIQERLASGDVPNDILGRYKYNTVAAILDIIFQEASVSDNELTTNMTTPYNVPVVCANGKYTSVLPVSPIAGNKSVKYATDDACNNYFARQSEDQNIFLNTIKNMARPEFYVRGKQVNWTGKPYSDTITFYIIPSFLDSSEDDEVVMPTAIGPIFARVIELIRSTDTRPEEVINNTVEDTNPRPTNYSS
jgi:hypothetical protein